MKKKFVLCPARHGHPEIDGLEAIFPSVIEDVTNTSAMLETAWNAVKDCESVDLYVTGLTVAVGAVIRACYSLGIALKLWHYDRDKDVYFPQTIITELDAEFMQQSMW